MDYIEKTDYDYEPYGEPEDWTWEGMKVYYYGWIFTDELTFVETFCTEDGRDWISFTERDKWTPEIEKIAEEHFVIKLKQK